MIDSQQLLAEYVRSGSETAFRELVARYLDLVYSIALRWVQGDTHLAEDVAQIVFTDLVRLAPTLSPKVMLGGWLHRHTCFVASKTMRGEHRRQIRERLAVEMNALTNSPQPNLTLLAPILDEAINELGEADRTAVLLRFFEQRNYRSVGEVLGSSEDAARIRISRALEKLCAILKRHGITTSVTAITALLTANVIQAAPVGVALTISASVLAGKTIGIATAGTVTKALAMTTLQKTIIGATLAVAIGTGIYEAHRIIQIRQENFGLHQQQTPLVQQTQQLIRERDEVQRQLAMLQAENERLKREAAQLPKLRSEVARLRKDSLLASDNAKDPTAIQAQALADKVKLLRQRFEKWPGKKTPELQLLSEQDWLNEVVNDQFDSDAACRQAMSRLRSKAIGQFSDAAKGAMEQFIQANNDQLPTDPSQLTPYLNAPAGSCLDGYEFADHEWVSLNNKHPLWALIEKGSFTPNGIALRDGSTLSDPQYDEYRIISSEGSWSYPVEKR